MYIFVFEIKIAGQWIIPLYKLILLRSVEILLRSQLWIQLFKEKYFSLFFIPTGMTYSILRSSHVFRKNLVSSMLLNVLHLINSLWKYGWRGTIWLKMHNLILFLRQPLSELLCIIFIMFNNRLRNERATFIMRSLFMTKLGFISVQHQGKVSILIFTSMAWALLKICYSDLSIVHKNISIYLP